MDDLGDVTRALNETLTTSADDGSSFVETFETFITSDDPRIRQASIEALHETLTKGSDDQKTTVLEHAGLTFIPLLLSRYRPSSPTYAPEIIRIIASSSAAKEVVLSLVESLGRLEDEAQGIDEDDIDDQEGADVPPTDHVECLRLVLVCFSLAIPRLKTERSTPTLLSLSDPLIDTFTVIAPATTFVTAPGLLEALCEMIKVTWTWVQTTLDSRGEQKAILTNLLFMGITFMSSRLDAKLVERIFMHLHPRYGQLHSVRDDSWMPAQRALQMALSVSATLGSSTQDLIHRLTHPSSISPYSSLAALTLLVTSLPGIRSEHTAAREDSASSELAVERNAVASGSNTGVTDHPVVSPTLLEDSMPVLSAALSADALDAGLAWTWYLVQNGAQVTYDTATLLLELLVPPAVGSSSPMTRMAIIKLVAKIIDMVEDPKDQALLFLQLAESENPFEGVRVQSITMLRDAISKPSSPLLAHLDTLTPTLFSLPSSTVSPTLSSFAPSTTSPAIDVPPLQLPGDALLSSMWLSWFIETVNLLRLVLTVDHEDKSGLRTAFRLKGIYSDWVIPQRSKVANLRQDPSLAPNGSMVDDDSHAMVDDVRGEVDFILDRWDDALDRLCEAIRSILGDEMDQVSGSGLPSIEE